MIYDMRFEAVPPQAAAVEGDDIDELLPARRYIRPYARYAFHSENARDDFLEACCLGTPPVEAHQSYLSSLGAHRIVVPAARDLSEALVTAGTLHDWASANLRSPFDIYVLGWQSGNPNLPFDSMLVTDDDTDAVYAKMRWTGL